MSVLRGVPMRFVGSGYRNLRRVGTRCPRGFRLPWVHNAWAASAHPTRLRLSDGCNGARRTGCRFAWVGVCPHGLRNSGYRNLRRVGTRYPRGFRLPWVQRVGSKCPPYSAAFAGWVQRGGVNGMPVCGWAYARAFSIGRQPETGKYGFRLPCLPLRAAAVFPPAPCPRSRKCSCSAPYRT